MINASVKRRGSIRLTRADRIYQVCLYTLVSILLLCSLFPLVYVLCLSFTSQQEIYARGPLMIVPYEPTLRAYRQIFGYSNTYIMGFVVSIARTVIGTCLTTLFSLFLGYGLSIRKLPGRRTMLFIVMVTVLYGGGMIPNFLTVQQTGLLNTFWCMIIPGLVNSWNVLVFKQFFSNLPEEVKEAGYIDGCSETRMLFSVVLPMSLPVLAALGLFTAVDHWNAWFDAMIYIQSNRSLYPLQLLLHNLFVDANLGFTVGGTEVFDIEAVSSSTTSIRMAVTVISVLPILCVYPFLQKYFVKGVYVGAVKG